MTDTSAHVFIRQYQQRFRDAAEGRYTVTQWDIVRATTVTNDVSHFANVQGSLGQCYYRRYLPSGSNNRVFASQNYSIGPQAFHAALNDFLAHPCLLTLDTDVPTLHQLRSRGCTMPLARFDVVGNDDAGFVWDELTFAAFASKQDALLFKLSNQDLLFRETEVPPLQKVA